MGPGGNAIAQAASQAIQATHQLTGRRTSSLKASFEAINMGVHAHQFSIGQELAGAAQSAIASTSFAPDLLPASSFSPKRKKAKVEESSLLDEVSGSDLLDWEWGSSNTEVKYCICNEISYDDMVACDHEDCPVEWYHFSCIGLDERNPPKGKWYCPTCLANMRGKK